MPAKLLPADLPIHSFSSASELESFFEREHTTAPGIYLKLGKKSSGIPTVSAAEAVEIALCFGWIDGQTNGLDTNWWLVRYTPRRAKSMWSKKNVETVARLTEEGRMRAAGIAAVNAAKSDGRWERAYAGSSTIVTPNDLLSALNQLPSAAAFFKTLNRTDRYSVLWRVETASPSNRDKRIEAIVQMLAVGTIPGASSKEDRKTSDTITRKTTIKKPKSKVV